MMRAIASTIPVPIPDIAVGKTMRTMVSHFEHAVHTRIHAAPWAPLAAILHNTHHDRDHQQHQRQRYECYPERSNPRTVIHSA